MWHESVNPSFHTNDRKTMSMIQSLMHWTYWTKITLKSKSNIYIYIYICIYIYIYIYISTSKSNGRSWQKRHSQKRPDKNFIFKDTFYRITTHLQKVSGYILYLQKSRPVNTCIFWYTSDHESDTWRQFRSAHHWIIDICYDDSLMISVTLNSRSHEIL